MTNIVFLPASAMDNIILVMHELSELVNVQNLTLGEQLRYKATLINLERVHKSINEFNAVYEQS